MRDELECVLNDLALNGKTEKHVSAGSPFDWRVAGGLEDIALAYPSATAEQIADARVYLERQIRRWPVHSSGRRVIRRRKPQSRGAGVYGGCSR